MSFMHQDSLLAVLCRPVKDKQYKEHLALLTLHAFALTFSSDP